MAGAQTPGERGAALEERLEQSLREFDDALSRERTELTDRRAEAGGEFGSDSPSAPAGTGVAAAAGGAAAGGGSSSGGGGMTGTGRGGGATPTTQVPDEGDDDVVARQLREAAESEQDPELREKLWEEYRKYKYGESGAPEGKGADAKAEAASSDEAAKKPEDGEATPQPEPKKKEGDD